MAALAATNGSAQAQLDLRVRVLGRALERLSVARLDDEQLARVSEHKIGHNPFVDALLGGVARGVALTDTTAAGQVTPLPVRVYRPTSKPAGLPPLSSTRTATAGPSLGGQDPSSPYASPLLAPTDHSGLPPQFAEHDPIRDDGLRCAAALRSAKVPVRTTEYVGMPHGYLSFPRLCRSAPSTAPSWPASSPRR